MKGRDELMSLAERLAEENPMKEGTRLLSSSKF